MKNRCKKKKNLVFLWFLTPINRIVNYDTILSYLDRCRDNRASSALPLSVRPGYDCTSARWSGKNWPAASVTRKPRTIVPIQVYRREAVGFSRTIRSDNALYRLWSRAFRKHDRRSLVSNGSIATKKKKTEISNWKTFFFSPSYFVCLRIRGVAAGSFDSERRLYSYK